MKKNSKASTWIIIKIVKLLRHQSFDDFIKTKKDKRIILLTTKAKKNYYNFDFKKDDTILFGRESAGVPDFCTRDS
jgi:tRNA (cytidine/uridine-2'-O-)-methyltransferase